MKVLYFLCYFTFISCSRSPIENRERSLRPYTGQLELVDDLQLDSFIQGLRKNILYLENNDLPYLNFTFADRQYTKSEYLQGLKKILVFYQKNKSKEAVLNYIQDNFDVYEVYGRENYGEVLLTSYYGPLIPGSKTKRPPFVQPLYELPENMVEIDLSSFEFEDYGIDFQDQTSLLAYMSSSKSAQGLKLIQAIPSRALIDTQNPLWPRPKIICYVDPVDAFFLQIQGSGSVRLSSGQLLHLGYSGQNGRKYVPIGKFLLEHIPLEEMSLQKIEAHLKSLPPEQRQDLMNKNPSYVFFRLLDSKPITTLGTEVIPGRTIATDLRYFPKGAIGFLQFNKPLFDLKSQTPIGKTPVGRLVIDQDTGGAINGTGRVDLFWGFGKQAKKYAGHLRDLAKLYYLAPKPNNRQISTTD